MNGMILECCAAPKELPLTIGNREKEIAEILTACIDNMNSLSNYVLGLEPTPIPKNESNCLERNVELNLNLAKTLLEQISNFRQVF